MTKIDSAAGPRGQRANSVENFRMKHAAGCRRMVAMFLLFRAFLESRTKMEANHRGIRDAIKGKKRTIAKFRRASLGNRRNSKRYWLKLVIVPQAWFWEDKALLNSAQISFRFTCTKYAIIYRTHSNRCWSGSGYVFALTVTSLTALRILRFQRCRAVAF